tara:strand:+ start:7745 stop:8728 length:984 start_codon:yes stop_codon:yes gene_type:complete
MSNNIYRDHRNNKRDVFLVENMIKADAVSPHIPEEHEDADNAKWAEFIKLATAHLPKDVKFSFLGHNTKCTVYLPNDFMEIGELLMEELKNPDGTVHERIYHVTSHHIENRRYCPWNSPWDYRTRSTKSLDKAVKNARTALRPNSLTDVARVTVERIKECYNSIRGKARNDFHNATTNLGFQGFHLDEPLPPVLGDIVRQTDMGLMRLSPKSDDLLTKWHKARDAHVRVEEFQYATLCWVHTNHVGDQVVETHKVRVGSGSLMEDKGKGLTSYDIDFCTRNRQTYCNNVPEDIQHKVSVLSMLDGGEFVDEVGYKYTDSVYYIFDEE